MDRIAIKENTKMQTISAFEYVTITVFAALIGVSIWLVCRCDILSSPQLTVNSMVYLLTLLFTLVLFAGCALVRIDRPVEKHIFEWMIILSFLSTLFSSSAGLCNGRVAGMAVLTMQITASALLGAYWIVFWIYQNRSYPQTDFSTVINVMVIVYMAAYIMFSLANFFLPVFFAMNKTGTLLYRTDYFTLTYFMVWFSFYLIYVFTRRCELKVKLTLSSYVFFPMVLDITALLLRDIDFFRSVFNSLNALAFLLPLYLIYFSLHIEQGHRMLEQKEELTAARINLMVSQIQPHFIYNSLTAIIGLIDIDSEKAKESIVSFSDYLRVNLNALKEVRLVPFEKELEHCRTYLSFELLRFKNISVEYDIQAENFSLPALTVQPLLENAVKHGVSKTGAGGTVIFSTRDDGDSIRITVSDNGVGFDANDIPAGTHIGLENVRKRLKDLCGGMLILNSEKNVGTEVTVIIPKEGAK